MKRWRGLREHKGDGKDTKEHKVDVEKDWLNDKDEAVKLADNDGLIGMKETM